jgi:hypothetical protein
MKKNTKKAFIILPVMAAMVFGTVGVAAASEKPEIDLSDDQIAALEEIKELHASGDHEAAHALMKENEIPPRKHKRARGPKDPEKRAAVLEALEANDYDAFLSIHEDAPFYDKLTEEHFNKMVEAHELREAGDYEGAREIMKSLRPHNPFRAKGSEH